MIFRTISAHAAALALALCSGTAEALDADSVTACDSLLAARRIDAGSGPARRETAEAGCRRIQRSTIGTVEQRAMIGGAPYECMTIAGAGRCVWIVP